MRSLLLIILLGIPLLINAGLPNQSQNNGRANDDIDNITSTLPVQHWRPEEEGYENNGSRLENYKSELHYTNSLSPPPLLSEQELEATTETPEWISTSAPVTEATATEAIPADDLRPLMPIEEPAADLVRPERNISSPVKKAYILLLGLSGAGKSSTLNFLFGNRNIAEIGGSDSTSAKPLINEYVFTPTDNSDSELHIIDTPGLGSPNGADHDNNLISSLKSYLQNHADLGDTIPNIVLMFSRFDDNRMQGNKSRFVSMLRGYQLLKDQFTTSDGTQPNIVYVLTRFLSETRPVKKKPAEKIGIFKQIIEEHTTYPRPIVIAVADNAVVDEDDVDQEDGNYKFPNKEWYPKNLIDKMIESCKNRSDFTCESILESVSNERQTIPFKQLEQQAAPVQRGGEKTNVYRETQFSIENTAVAAALAEAYEKIDPALQSSYPGSLEVLQSGFQDKGIRNIEDVPRNDDQIILLLQGMNMNLAMVDTFERAFRVTVPRYPFDLLTGMGYDVIDDAPLKKSPFDFEKLKFSQAGYMIPETMTLSLLDQSANIFNFYDNFDAMVSARSQALGLPDRVQAEAEDRTMRPGENLINRWSKSASEVTLTAIHETRTLQLMLNENVQFKPEFREKIQLMPSFDLTDKDSVAAWKDLFEEYGAYVVVSAYGGGTIETKLTVSGDELGKLRQKTFDSIREVVSSLPQYTGASQVFKNDWNTVAFEFQYQGGNTQYIEGNLDVISQSSTKQSLNKWKESLKIEPVMLENYIQLLPLSEYVKQINSSIAIEMDPARRAYLTGNLKYVEPKEPEITTTTEDTSIPKFDEDEGEVTQIKERLDEFEKALEKSRRDREEAQQRILDIMRNNTKAAEDYTPPTRQTTTRRPTTTTARVTTTTKRAPFMPPATENPNKYNQWAIPNQSLYKCGHSLGCYKQTGFSYDVTNDRPLPATPYQYNADSLCKYLPDPQPNVLHPFYVYQEFETTRNYIDYRQTSIGSGFLLNRQIYKGGMIHGYNVLNQRNNNRKFITISMEFRLHENLIRDGCSYLNLEFRNDVAELPVYDRTSCASAYKWKVFLTKYGTHFVNSTFVGGAIDITAYGKFMQKIMKANLNTQDQRRSFFEKLDWAVEDFNFTVRGGDTSIFQTTADFFENNFKRYSTSLMTRGGISLNTDITLSSLEPLICSVKYEIWNSFREARNHFIHKELSLCSGVDAWTKPCKPYLPNVKTCYLREGRSCYWYQPDSHHYCVQNAFCRYEPKSSNQYGWCRCTEGTIRTANGLCVSQ